jgi:hypothetical protein
LRPCHDGGSLWSSADRKLVSLTVTISFANRLRNNAGNTGSRLPLRYGSYRNEGKFGKPPEVSTSKLSLSSGYRCLPFSWPHNRLMMLVAAPFTFPTPSDAGGRQIPTTSGVGYHKVGFTLDTQDRIPYSPSWEKGLLHRHQSRRIQHRISAVLRDCWMTECLNSNIFDKRF